MGNKTKIRHWQDYYVQCYLMPESHCFRDSAVTASDTTLVQFKSDI